MAQYLSPISGAAKSGNKTPKAAEFLGFSKSQTLDENIWGYSTSLALNLEIE